MSVVSSGSIWIWSCPFFLFFLDPLLNITIYEQSKYNNSYSLSMYNFNFCCLYDIYCTSCIDVFTMCSVKDWHNESSSAKESVGNWKQRVVHKQVGVSIIVIKSSEGQLRKCKCASCVVTDPELQTMWLNISKCLVKVVLWHKCVTLYMYVLQWLCFSRPKSNFNGRMFIFKAFSLWLHWHICCVHQNKEKSRFCPPSWPSSN